MTTSIKKEDSVDIFSGSRLRQVRKIRGYTQEQLGGLLKISKDYVSRIEKGERNPGPHVMDAIKKFMEVGGPDNFGDLRETVFNEVNKFFETGEGPMLNNATDEPAAPQARGTHTDKDFKEMVTQIKLLNKMVAHLETMVADRDKQIVRLESEQTAHVAVKKKQVI